MWHSIHFSQGLYLVKLPFDRPDLPQLEIDEMLRLVRDVGTKVAAHHTVPGGVVLLVELLWKCWIFSGTLGMPIYSSYGH